MLLRDLHHWLESHDLPDRWWVALGQGIGDAMLPLADAVRLQEEHPGVTISLLHEKDTDDPGAEWFRLEVKKHTRLKVVCREREKAGVASAPNPVARQARVAAVSASAVPAGNGDLRQEVELLRQEVESLRNIADELLGPVNEAKLSLDKRQAFLDECETALFEKAHKHEEMRAELEQVREDLEERETRLAGREQQVACAS